MSLFTLLKLTRTRHLLGGKQVLPGTHGSVKTAEESAHWYAYRRDGKKQVKVRLYTDKAASLSEMARMNTALERGEAGMVNPHKEHLERPVGEHAEEYFASVVASGKVKEGKYLKEKRRILDTVFRVAKVGTLADLKAAAVDAYLDGLKTSAATRRVHHTAVNAFAEWLVQKKRLPSNPLIGVARPQGGRVVRKRRALPAAELQRLITAARERPLHDALYKPRKGGKGRPSTEPRLLSKASRALFAEMGRGRALLYKAAVYTGLRRGELAALKVKFLNLDRKPYPALELPGEFTKNGDEAKLLLVPALGEELRRWVADTGRGPDDAVFDVPTKVMPGMLLDLKRAGIEYRDEKGRYADFHALRKSANTMLGLAGVACPGAAAVHAPQRRYGSPWACTTTRPCPT
jgi:integrase